MSPSLALGNSQFSYPRSQDGSVRGSMQVTPQGWGACLGCSWTSPVLRGRWSPGGQLSLLMLDQLAQPIPVTLTGKPQEMLGGFL